MRTSSFSLRRNGVCLFLFVSVLLSKPAFSQVTFDIAHTPFSYRGSYMAFSSREAYKKPVEPFKIYLRDISGRIDRDGIFRIEFLEDGQIIKPQITATPSIIKINADKSYKKKAGICYQDENTVRIKSDWTIRLTGLVTPLEDNDSECTFYLDKVNDKQFRFYRYHFARYGITLLSGNISSRINKDGEMIIEINRVNDASCEIAITEYQSEWNVKWPARSFEECAEESQKAFLNWCGQPENIPAEFESTWYLANYINWSAYVKKRGLMTRDGILMSKNWMHHIWSWDHCFTAMALAAEDKKDAAWDQYMILFDHQDELGALPDRMNDYSLLRGYVKPPVHGLVLAWLMDHNVVNEDRLREIYPKLSAWTNFWFDYRDDDHNGLPQYNHGNDSGWDNGTFFDSGTPVEGPDLAAFLVIQMETLSDVAEKLGKYTEARQWEQRAENLTHKLIGRLWTGDKFVAKLNRSDKYNENSESLMAYLPLILGDRLPEKIRTKLIADLEGNHSNLTEYGLATENPESPLYEADGYWRGPIWAPSTWIMTEGLKRCGKNDLARDIAVKYCNMCRNTGFGENFDALTGQSLRDPAYTWTTSVFIIFMKYND